MKKNIKIKGTVNDFFTFGDKFGFVNLSPENGEFPDIKKGSYVCWSEVDDKEYFGMFYFGPKTLFDNNLDFIDVCLFGLEDAIKGYDVELELGKFMREPIKFRSEEELLQTLEVDKRDLFEYIKNLPYDMV